MQLSQIRTLVPTVADRLAVKLAIGLVIFVSGCGGGGGGSPNPVLGTVAFMTNENVALSGAVTATDPGGSQLTYSQLGNPLSGTVSFTADGKFTYTPKPNFTGGDSFGIQATDAAGNTDGFVGLP